MIICSILDGTKFFLKIAGKTNGNKTVTLLTRQDSDLANQTAESNLLVIISWLWSHALILCYGAIPFNPILPKFLA
jgi:hypothetical protein